MVQSALGVCLIVVDYKCTGSFNQIIFSLCERQGTIGYQQCSIVMDWELTVCTGTLYAILCGGSYLLSVAIN